MGQYPDAWPPQEIVPANNVDLRIPQQNILIGGDLEKLVSLNELESFDSTGYLLIFAKVSFDNKLYNLTGIDKLIIDNKENLMMKVFA